MTMRIMPPANGATTTVNGRTYTCAAGSTVDVPDHDALVLESNGWTLVAQHGANTTALRPTNPVKNSTYLDTTLGFVIKFDGKVWRNPVSGAAV